MRSDITSRTRVIALVGDPVDHSLSPLLQNAAFAAAGVDGVYVACRCNDDDLPGFVRAMGRTGGGGNVTLPHKERAAAVVDVPSDAVRRTGACNTFWGENDELHGDNTDVEGLRRTHVAFLGEPPEGHRVLLLGAGGAARAALVALLDDGVAEICLFNRSTERARAVARRIGGERVHVVPMRAELEDESFDLIVNATRLGLDPEDPLPLELEHLSDVGAVLDMVYGPEETPFVKKARELGIKATDGKEMLVQQGAASFERWWGQSAPLEAMRDALKASGRVSGGG